VEDVASGVAAALEAAADVAAAAAAAAAAAVAGEEEEDCASWSSGGGVMHAGGSLALTAAAVAELVAVPAPTRLCGPSRGDGEGAELGGEEGRGWEGPGGAAVEWEAEAALLWAEALPLLRSSHLAPSCLAPPSASASPRQHIDRTAAAWLAALEADGEEGGGGGGEGGGAARRGEEAVAQAGAAAHRGLVCVSLLAGSLPPVDASAFLSRHARPLFPPVAASSAACSGAPLPLALLRVLLPSLLSRGVEPAAALPPDFDAELLRGLRLLTRAAVSVGHPAPHRRAPLDERGDAGRRHRRREPRPRAPTRRSARGEKGR